MVAHPSGGCPPQTSSASRSIETTRFASSSSSASTARCRGPPSGSTHPDLQTSSGPRMPNSTGPVSPATASAAITHPARLSPPAARASGLDHSTTRPAAGPPLFQATVQADPKAIPLAPR